MVILWRTRQKDPARGYARSFLRQARDLLGPCLAHGTRIVVNAGGLEPAGLAAALRELASELGVDARIAHVEGDDLLPRLPELTAPGDGLTDPVTGEPLPDGPVPPLTANAYLGTWGIAHAMQTGADVAVTGRATDASLTVGPAAWRFGWRRDDWDRLAGATVAGHVIECRAQATGGNHVFLDELPTDGPALPGSRSRRSPATAPPRSPSIRAPAAGSPCTPSPGNCSTRSADTASSAPTSSPGSTRSGWTRTVPTASRSTGGKASHHLHAHRRPPGTRAGRPATVQRTVGRARAVELRQLHPDRSPRPTPSRSAPTDRGVTIRGHATGQDEAAR